MKFIDANILLDFTLKRAHYPDAKQVFELAVNRQIHAYITPSIVHIAGYWLTKFYGVVTAKELLLTLLIDVPVIAIPHEITLLALHSKINDIEDALQYYTAIHHNLEYFVSRDKQLQKESTPILPVCTAKQFLKEII